MITCEGLEAFSAEIDEQKAEVIDKLLEFFMTDMMFFWGEEKSLAERQQAVWGPLLQWGEEEFETKFVKAKGLDVPEQDLQSGARIRFFMEGLTSRELTVFYFTTYVTKSVLLAAAFVKRHIDAGQVFDAASLEEVWQQATWGMDDAIERNHQELKEDLGVLAAFLG